MDAIEEFTTPAGSRNYWHSIRFPMHAADGVRLIGGVAVDITARIRAELALKDSEERLRLAQQIAGVGTFEWNIQTGTGVGTLELEKMYGLTPGSFDSNAFTQKEWERLIHPEDRVATVRAIENAIESGLPGGCEWRIIRPDGTVRWLRGLFQSFRDESGRLHRLIGVTMDITDSKHAEDALKDSEARYRAIFDAAGVSLWEKDCSAVYSELQALAARHGDELGAYFDSHPEHVMALARQVRVVNVNSASLKLFGASNKEDLLGQMERDLIAYAQPVFRDELLAFAQGAQHFDGEAVVTTLHHERRNVLTTVTVVSSARPLQRVLVSLVDITEIKTYRERLEEAVADRTAQLKAANDELEAFSFSVSHDLRAPLRAVDGFCKSLEIDCGPQLGETGWHYLTRIQRATSRMGELIEALLRLSRITRLELNRERFNISELAQQISESICQYEPPREITVSIQPDLFVNADRNLLSIALENLFGNALKYTAHVAEARIEFRQEKINGEPVFCLADNGAGFNMANADRLFSAFQRMHTDNEFPGVGIGLATVHRIIRRHNGRIWADAAPGRGARFYFSIGK